MSEKNAKRWDSFGEGLIARNLKNEEMINEILFDKCKFDFLNLDERILRGLARSGFNKISFIQKEAIPLGRVGLDLVLKARSGSGKTCAYTCILYDLLVPGESTQVLIVAPTREIAFQVSHVVRAIGVYYENVKIALCTGGFKVGRDVEDIQKAQIIIGTPGRLIQLIELGHLNPSSIRLLVLDEADKLFDDQMRDQMTALMSRLPDAKQVIAVSATFPDDLKAQVEKYLKDPQIITAGTDGIFPARNAQFYAVVGSKTNYTHKLMIVKKWIDHLPFNQLIIFVNTKESGQKIATNFQSTNYSCNYMFGDLVQTERFEIFKKFHAQKFNILVTTDLFARGVDFKNVNMIINFDLPDSKETYLHRVGRAGRFGVDCLTLNLIEIGPEELIYQDYERELGFESHIIPENLHRDNPWAVLDERYKHIELTDYQKFDRMLNAHRFRPPCRNWHIDPMADPFDPNIVNPQKRRKLKPGHEESLRPSYYKKRGIYMRKPLTVNKAHADGREFLPENKGCSIKELYPEEAFEGTVEYYSSSEEEEESMPPGGWPGCCGGHILPGTNRWLSLDEDGNPIRHQVYVYPKVPPKKNNSLA